MFPAPSVDPAVTQQQVEQIVDRTVRWDQLGQHMMLTVQAFQRLHTALDGKFTR